MISGGYCVGETPLPIPNRAVKPHSADGTWLARAWESRSPPVLLHEPPSWAARRRSRAITPRRRRVSSSSRARPVPECPPFAGLRVLGGFGPPCRSETPGVGVAAGSWVTDRSLGARSVPRGLSTTSSAPAALAAPAASARFGERRALSRRDRPHRGRRARDRPHRGGGARDRPHRGGGARDRAPSRAPCPGRAVGHARRRDECRLPRLIAALGDIRRSTTLRAQSPAPGPDACLRRPTALGPPGDGRPERR
jgi:hypothetical protein